MPNFVGLPAEVAELCNVIQLLVADDEALREIIQQLNPVLTAHHIVAAHCTVAPESTQAAAEVVQRAGARSLDAPIHRQLRSLLKKASSFIMSRATTARRTEVLQFLEASSKEIAEFGDIGEATRANLADERGDGGECAIRRRSVSLWSRSAA